MKKAMMIAAIAAVAVAAFAAARQYSTGETAAAVKSLFVAHGLRGARYDAERNTCSLNFTDGTAVVVPAGE